MSKVRNRFIDAVAAAYGGDRERKLAAKAWVADETAGAAEEDLLPAIRRWEGIDAKKRWKHREATLLVLWAMISLMMIFPFYLLLKETDEVMIEPFGRRILKLGQGIEEWSPNYAPKDSKPHLFERKGIPSHERKKLLWESDPGNVAYFIDYAATARWAASLPPDFRAIADKLDPGNAWFDQFEAASMGYGSVIKVTGKYKAQIGRLPDSWKILDQVKFEESLDLLRHATRKTEYRNHVPDMFRERLEALPSPADARMRRAHLHLLETDAVTEIGLVPLLCAHAWSLAEAGDTEGFQELMEIRRSMVEQRLRGGEIHWMKERLTWSTIINTAPEFKRAALKLGLKDDARDFGRLIDEDSKRRKASRARETEDSDVSGEKGVMAGGLIYHNFINSGDLPSISDAELAPGRLSEHDYVARSHAILLWSVTGICCVAVFLYRFKASGFLRVAAARMESLIRPVDWAWITAGGILLPIAVFLIAMLFTPFGGRQASYDRLGGFLDMGGFVARFSMLGILLLIVPVLLARWRLGLRMQMLGRARPCVRGWLAVLCVVILAGISEYEPESWVQLWKERWYLQDEKWLKWLDLDWPRFLLAGIPVLWVVGNVWMSVFAPAGNLLRYLVMSRMLVKVYASAMFGIAMMVFGFHLSQQYWFERDEFMKPTLAEPDFPSYNYRVALQLREDMRKIWDAR